MAQAQAATDTRTSDSPGSEQTKVAVATLFSNGTIQVMSLGRPVKVHNAAYPYLGGEQVTVPAGAMGVLRVGDVGLLFLCGGSVSSFDFKNGAGVLSLERGSARVITLATDAVAIQAGEQILRGSASDTTVFAAEVARTGDELTVLPLAGTTATDDSARLSSDGAGYNIWAVSDGRATALGFPASLPVPAALRGPLSTLLGGGDYLRRTSELALVLAQNRTPLPAEPIDLPPFLAPPGTPPLALAAPDPSDLFDPNALPPPAAGPARLAVVVPAPSLPVSGTGGGALATPE